MNKKLEIRQLEAIIKLQESKATPFIYRPVFMPIIWVICGAVILSSKKAYEAELLHPYLFISIIMVMGVGIGFHVVYKASFKAWPILGSYVNTDEIKEHLIKLKT
ncbi:MAG: hypothetical protein V7785_15580 [Bermanella sp.]